MNVEPEQRAALLGEYIAEHSATVRAAARAFGCSKSTVHKDVSTRLRAVDAALFARVQAVLARNKAERHLRGGAATRRKYYFIIETIVNRITSVFLVHGRYEYIITEFPQVMHLV